MMVENFLVEHFWIKLNRYDVRVETNRLLMDRIQTIATQQNRSTLVFISLLVLILSKTLKKSFCK